MTARRDERWLIVNADDFGAGAAVNAGVAAGHRAGIITSASLLAAGPATAAALALSDELPALGVGVHLTLCDGRAAAPPGAAPSLRDERGFLPADAGAFLGRFLAGTIKLADVRAELAAQLALVRDAGVRITHVDSHQHLHHLPGVADITIELAKRFGVRAVRRARCRLFPRRRRWLARQFALRLCAEAFGVRAARAGLAMPDGFLGQEDAGRLTAALLSRELGRLRPGVWELACHPAAAPDDGAPAGYDRAGELAALCAPEVREALAARRVRLINFAAL